MFLTHRIEEITAQSTDTRHAIGAFVLQERAHLADYTIADIAEALRTSHQNAAASKEPLLGYHRRQAYVPHS